MSDDRRLALRPEFPTTVAACLDEMASIDKERERMLRKEQAALEAYETIRDERRELDRRHHDIKRKKKAIEVANTEIVRSLILPSYRSVLSILTSGRRRRSLIPYSHISHGWSMVGTATDSTIKAPSSR